jgi:hypothetical protein
MDDVFLVTMLFVAVVIGFSLGGLILSGNVADEYRQQAIERGHGLYCPDTGAFAWMGECGND